MQLAPAPFFQEIAHAEVAGTAHWVTTGDGLRLRIAHWQDGAARGTVLIFPGRTEFVEKYAQIASSLARHGLASIAVDWRGQGLADRMLDNPAVGHVARFSDYQQDVAAVHAAVATLGLPDPLYLLAHSMGGAIGLRALLRGLPVAATAFSGPMWGLQMAPHLRPAAWTLSHAMPIIGQGHRLPPGSRLDHHVLAEGFESNLLTRDRRQFEIMRDQLTRRPELSLGEPSYVWLREALLEMRALARQPSPRLACLTLLGSNERIVSLEAIHRRMGAWSDGRLEIVPEGEHEVLMEAPAIAEPLIEALAEHFLARRLA